MIIAHNFNEAYQQYQSGLIPYRLIQEQAAVILGLCSNTSPIVTSALDITNCDIHWLLQQDEAGLAYSDYLGGNVYVCKTEDDLKQIIGCDFKWAVIPPLLTASKSRN